MRVCVWSDDVGATLKSVHTHDTHEKTSMTPHVKKTANSPRDVNLFSVRLQKINLRPWGHWPSF